MTGKERSTLRGFANKLDAIQQIGRSGIGEAMIKNIDDALTARELIKLRTLENCEYSPAEAAQILAEATGAEVIQVIGYRFVLYRRNPKINNYGI